MVNPMDQEDMLLDEIKPISSTAATAAVAALLDDIRLFTADATWTKRKRWTKEMKETSTMVEYSFIGEGTPATCEMKE